MREALRRIGRLDPAALRAAPDPRLAGRRSATGRARSSTSTARAARLVFFRRRSHAPVRLERVPPARAGARRAPGRGRAGARRRAARAAGGRARVVRPRRGGGARCSSSTRRPRRGRGRRRSSPPCRRSPGVVLRGEGGPAAAVGRPVLSPRARARPPRGGRAAVAPGRLPAGEPRRERAPRRGGARPARGRTGRTCSSSSAGPGNFTAPLARRARAVAAVEVQGPALELAREDLRGAANVRFYAGDALKVAAALAAERGAGKPGFGAVLLDPPREGAKGIGPSAPRPGGGARRLRLLRPRHPRPRRPRLRRGGLPRRRGPARGHVPADAPRRGSGAARVPSDAAAPCGPLHAMTPR